jgi:hypothetical protein
MKTSVMSGNELKSQQVQKILPHLLRLASFTDIDRLF